MSPFVAASPEPIYSFDDALKTILERSTLIHVQETRVESAEWSVFAKKMIFLPHIAASASTTDYSNGNSDLPETQAANLTARINLFKFGADVSALEGARRDRAAQGQSLEDAKLTSEQNGVEAIIGSIEKKMDIDVLIQDVDTFRVYLDIAQQRYSHGYLPQQEVDKVAIDLANAQARLKDFQAQAAQAQYVLGRLLGPGAVNTVWPWRERLIAKRVNRVLQENFSADLRPDVKASRETVAAESARVDSFYHASFPSLDLTVTQGMSQYPGGGNYVNSTFLGITVPLFDSFRDYSSYKIQYETYAAADLQYRQLVIDAEGQWHTAKDIFSIALDTALARTKTLSISQRIYDANQMRFKQGKASANDLAVDRARLVESQLLEIQGWRSAHVEFSRLCHALGRPISHCEN